MRPLVVTVVFLALALSAFGQESSSGSITGSALDPQGAAIPNAQITLREESRKFTLTATTTDEGRFVFAQVPPGPYTMSIQKTGFKTFEQRGILLAANERMTFPPFVLVVGATSDSIEVNSQAATLRTESSERSDNLSATQVANIAVNGRNPLDLIKLSPGVVSSADFKTAGNTGIGQISGNGVGTASNQITLNGMSVMDMGGNNWQMATFSLDTVQEMRIISGAYQAEYGLAGGLQILAVSKSGSSQFHGSGYITHRNEGLNANTWLNNRQRLPRSLLRVNAPGFNIGGPVTIPHVFNTAKDKFYFFWSEEFQRQLIPVTTPFRVTVPTALERQGNFSQSVDSSGRPIPAILDPITRNPIPGNIIPASQQYAPGIAYMKLLPLPNAPGSISGGFNYQSQVSTPGPRREDLLRLDYNESSKLRFWGHYLNTANNWQGPYGSLVTSNVPVGQLVISVPGYSAATGFTYIINPTMTNEFTIGRSHNSSDYEGADDTYKRAHSGATFNVLYPSAVVDDYLPTVTYGGSRIANSANINMAFAPFHNTESVWDISDTLSKIARKHLLKTGIYIQTDLKIEDTRGAAAGTFNFGDNAANPYDTGFGLSNLATGVFQTFSQASRKIASPLRSSNIEGYIQDTWKVRTNLTLDYGLRLAYYGPSYDRSRQATSFLGSLWDPTKAPRLYVPAIVGGQRAGLDPVTGQTVPAYNIAKIVPNTGSLGNGMLPGTQNKYLTQNRPPQIGPRFGLAWDVGGKQRLVFHLAGGLYYDRTPLFRITQMIGNPPLVLSPQIQYGLVENITATNAIIPALGGVWGRDPAGKIPTIYSFTSGFEIRLPGSFRLSPSYVGSMARHLGGFLTAPLNDVPYGATFLPQNQDPTLPPSSSGLNSLAPDFLRPYRGYADISLIPNEATSNYNSLQVQLNRRVSKGLFMGLSYTWAKSLGVDAFRIDQNTRKANYGPQSIDQRQSLTVNYVYKLPDLGKSNHVLHAIVDQWQLSGIASFQTGTAYGATYSYAGVSNQALTGSPSTAEAPRIALVGKPNTGSNDPYNRLNASAFAPPKVGSIGMESPERYLWNPGVNNWNLSLEKAIAIREKVNLRFRIDAFNVFNHSQFSAVNNTLAFSTAGVPTNLPYNSTGQLVNPNGFGTVSASRDPRILQMLAKLTF